MKQIKIFPIGINDGITPCEVEEQVNKFLRGLYERGIQGEVKATSEFVLVEWEEEKKDTI